MQNTDLRNIPIECPQCGRVSDSVKCYRLPGIWVSLVFYLYYTSRNYVGCPTCIRKKIFVHGFTYNIVTGNVYWLIMIVPWMLIQLARSFTKGHSTEIVGILRHDNPASGE